MAAIFTRKIARVEKDPTGSKQTGPGEVHFLYLDDKRSDLEPFHMMTAMFTADNLDPMIKKASLEQFWTLGEEELLKKHQDWLNRAPIKNKSISGIFRARH